MLWKKGRVRRTLKDRAYVYYPVLTRRRALRHALGDMVERLFGGSAESLVVSLVESRHLTPEALARLTRALERAEERRRWRPLAAGVGASRASVAVPRAASTGISGSAAAWTSLGQAPAASLAPSPQVTTAVAALYLASVLLTAVRRARSWRRALALRRSALPGPLLEAVRIEAERCRHQLGLGDVVVRLSRAVDSPVTFGTRRPLILLPADLVGSWERDQVGAALGHELAQRAAARFLLERGRRVGGAPDRLPSRDRLAAAPDPPVPGTGLRRAGGGCAFLRDRRPPAGGGIGAGRFLCGNRRAGNRQPRGRGLLDGPGGAMGRSALGGPEDRREGPSSSRAPTARRIRSSCASPAKGWPTTWKWAAAPKWAPRGHDLVVKMKRSK